MIADDIRAVRAALGISQAELARRLRVHERSVENWEAGRTRPLPVYAAAIRRLQRKVEKEQVK